MTPKTLEEFMLEAMSELTNFDERNLTRYGERLAAEILRVAEEWCNEPCDTGQITTIDTGDDIVLEPVFSTNGLYLSGNQLLDFLKSYIQPVKKESDE